ncbi:hypothetical protein COLO4_38161 [Corchorus olitorius]|uniref:Uncharacterized protein n=1 Tax=Corchorus olitorius TaxID=93759 RepID=A0A1R3FWL7_9ROSI|nr:hypothetical protein COLO4_38161 [Corchorus olitorius]
MEGSLRIGKDFQCVLLRENKNSGRGRVRRGRVCRVRGCEAWEECPESEDKRERETLCWTFMQMNWLKTHVIRTSWLRFEGKKNLAIPPFRF